MERLTLDKKDSFLVKNGDVEFRSPCFGCESIRRCNPYKMPCGYYNALKKLKKYEDLEEQGKLLRLFCTVGDKLYEPRPDRNIITEYVTNYIGYYGENYEIFIGWTLNSGIYSNLSGVFASEIGKTVFLSREEAEDALKTLKH